MLYIYSIVKVWGLSKDTVHLCMFLYVFQLVCISVDLYRFGYKDDY